MSKKNPLALTEIEPATFRFVAPLCYRGPLNLTVLKVNTNL